MINSLNSLCNEKNRGIKSYLSFRLDFVRLHSSNKVFLVLQCSITDAAPTGLRHWKGSVSFCFASLCLLVRNMYMEKPISELN